MNLKTISDSINILYDLDITDFLSSQNTNIYSVIYFSNKTNILLPTSNVIVISPKATKFKGVTLKKINHRIMKYISNNSIITIDLDDTVTFQYMKYLLKNLINLFKILHKHNMNLNYCYNNRRILCLLSCDNNMKYFEDICTTLKALSANSKRNQYEIIYDAVCKYLDNEFTEKNLCGFCNDVCNASRHGLTHYEKNGCCYTINYGPGGIITGHQPCKYLINKHCTANCISCKLNTCYYLRMQNVEYKIREILLLACFFSFKQHLVLKYNVFKTREEILNKLTHVNYIPFIVYYVLSLYKIN